MIRLAAIAVIALAALSRASEADHMPQLTLEGAQAIFGSFIRPGTLFQVGPYKFRIAHSASHSPRPGVFVVEIETQPVP